MRKSLLLMTLPIVSACSTTPPPEAAMTPPPATAEATTPAEPALVYPATRREDVVETQFGTPVADPYRWLENDVRKDPAVAAWVAEENKVTNGFLSTLPGRDILKKRMTELYNYERVGTPVKKGNRYFYQRNSGLQNQSPLYVRDSLNGPERLLIDPNTFSTDGATALAEWVPSEDGKYLLYAIQDGGSDWRTLKVLDVASGKVIGDEIKWVKFSGLSWAKDSKGFVYSRYPESAAGADFVSLNKNQMVYFHRVGTAQAADRLLYATPDRPDLNHGAVISDDGSTLVVTSSSGTDERYEVTLLDWQKKGAKPRTLIPGFTHDYSYIGNRGSTYYFQTNDGAPRLKVVAIDVNAARPNKKVIVDEQPETLSGSSLVGGKLILSYLKDASTEVRVHSLAGAKERVIELPGLGTAGGFSGDLDDPETFYAFTSFNRPTTIYRYDVRSNASTAWFSPKLLFNPDDFTVEQRFYASKDGTRVPMFIVRKKGVTGPAPTLLYGYGGFNISLTPSFSATRLAWLEQGGAWVQANIRGGGEYGKAWHDAGRLQNKQNVFDDFIAAGEALIATGVTPKGGLAVQGGSNGGLLIGAVVNQRPDLFAAANPAVGVMDMLRFDRFTAGRYWVDDYGYPNKEADFRTLLSYSPYHNIKAGVRYPAVLVTTADTDDRVVPGHSFKYIAALQHADPNGQPHLIRIETRAGHGSGKPTDKIIEEASDVSAFMAKYTGLEIK
ncbi:prolyl oligopeptidase family serine peptidase [Sphingomonas astaxanthinifaciens]|uniref:prolyl oligopeptidase n=1 Tax=Sphingomonas astaxanthinifaciens DSM 22298 TaxID=1123267 RepID=A0ABQ5Z3I7_9SPHN|nr:prolyl endopeptidase [Sphingomonas astaxanthinifaciens DSM 22298]